MEMFMQFFLFFVTVLQFLFPFAFKDAEVPETSTDIVIEETTVEPTEHTHSGGNANCLTSAVCEVCGEIYGGKGSHVYSKKTKAPTCTTGGYTTYTCRFCLHSYDSDITAATGHTYEKTETEPTCTASGFAVYTCKTCGASYNEKIADANGHSYESITVSADCDKGAQIIYTCSVCGNSYTEVTSGAIGHSYTVVVTVPTCTKGGYSTYTCDVCGDTYEADETDATGHSFTEYVYDDNANCTADGTETAYCDNGCGSFKTQTVAGSQGDHVDKNEDTYCDYCNDKLHIEFTYLEYPAEAVKSAEAWGLTVSTITNRADENDDIYVANQGYNDVNGIIVSPYYTVNVDGTSVPVYAATTYIGETGQGTLHSFSEIYIKDGEYDTFEIEISSSVTLKNAVVLPASLGCTATTENGVVTAVLSGYGVYTFMFNDKNQSYIYTVFVREEIDEDAEIAALREQGYTVTEVSGYLADWTYTCFSGSASANNVIYLRKGAYVTAKHMFDINSDSDNASVTEDGASANNGIGLNRFPFVSAHNTNNIKILGYGVLDLTHLDRGERRGLVFTFANNVEVRGVKLINAPEWSIITYRCDTVSIKDVDVFGYRLNSDAFDICNSKNVTVDGCFARSGDDIFNVKALGGDTNAVTDNIVFTNCYAWAAKARAFGIFGECNRNISNVTFKDSFVLWHDADWDYDRIPALGIVVETASNDENSPITFSGISFENIEIGRNDAAAMNCIIFSGITNFTLEDITFKNISYGSNAVLNRVVDYGGENSNNSIQVTFDGVTCNGTAVVDSNKTQYFSEESYWGNYITVK